MKIDTTINRAEKSHAIFSEKNIIRMFDIVIACILLLALSPLILLVSLVLFFVVGRPVFFKQKRPGLEGKLFTILKFRTMQSIDTHEKNIQPDCQMLTTLGIFLRRYSLDELPQLWNVLKGDLSLVGPRPLLEEYLQYYTPIQARRHDVRPGITGLAQIKGRNSISWERKFKWDVWYVEHQSLFLNFKILWLTLLHLMKPQGINSSAHVTMKPFRGR